MVYRPNYQMEKCIGIVTFKTYAGGFSKNMHMKKQDLLAGR